MAADWNFYGQSRFATWYNSDDYDVSGAQYEDDADLQWENGGNSRIGANVKFNDQIGGAFEIGFDVGSLDMYQRKIYGTYTFGGGSELLIGQTYTPTALFYSNSVYGGDGDLLGLGEFYDGRWPMIQWKTGGLKVALITPRNRASLLTDPTDPTDTTNGVGDPSLDFMLPKIEASYGFKTDMFFVDLAGGYQTYTIDGGNGGTDYDIDSYIGIIGAGANFGAFYVKASAHMGQNLGNFGSSGPYVVAGFDGLDKSAVLVGTEVKDTDAMGFVGVVGFNVSEMLSFEGGVGYQNYEKDVVNTEDETYMQYYLQATINIAPGFFIIPEVGYIEADPDNFGAATDPNPTRTYFGAKWQINF
jgi:hypothetical protein